MLIDYNVSQDGLRIESFPKGVLDIKATMDCFGKIKNDKKIKQGAIEIVNFKDVSDFQISYLESDKISRSYKEPKALKKMKATIFVCETDLAFGIGRMLEAVHEIANPNHKVLLVRSENELEDVIKQV